MRKEIEVVCERIRSIRNSKGISILKLANDSGLSHSAIFYIESKRKEPTLESLYRIAEALKVNITDLM